MFKASIGCRKNSSLELIELENEVGDDDGGPARDRLGGKWDRVGGGGSGKCGASLTYGPSRTPVQL